MTSVSWATEVIELAAVFFAVGLAHLFVSLVGYHASGVPMLVISGTALLGGAVVHRWWAARRHAEPAVGQGLSRVEDLLSVPASGRDLMQIRTTLPDRPGSLASLCTQLAALEVNVLAIQVHPAVGGAVDELLVVAPRGVTMDEVTAAVDVGGGTCTTATAADVHDLVDPATRALTIAADVVRDPGLLEPALTALLSAASVTSRPPVDITEGVAPLRGPGGRTMFLSRQSPPFTPTELSRAQALVDLCSRSFDTSEHRSHAVETARTRNAGKHVEERPETPADGDFRASVLGTMLRALDDWTLFHFNPPFGRTRGAPGSGSVDQPRPEPSS